MARNVNYELTFKTLWIGKVEVFLGTNGDKIWKLKKSNWYLS